jgi:hypothetical protein
MKEDEEKVIGLLGAVSATGRLSAAIIPTLIGVAKKELTTATPEGHDLNPRSAELVAALALIINGMLLVEDHPEITPQKLMDLAVNVKEVLEHQDIISKKEAKGDIVKDRVREALRREREGGGSQKKEASGGFLSDEELQRMFNVND